MIENLSAERIAELAELAEKDLLQDEQESDPVNNSDHSTPIERINRVISLPHVKDYFYTTGIKAIIAEGRGFLGRVYLLGTVAYVCSKGLMLGEADENKNWNEGEGTPLTQESLDALSKKLAGSRLVNKINSFSTEKARLAILDIIRNPQIHTS